MTYSEYQKQYERNKRRKQRLETKIDRYKREDRCWDCDQLRKGDKSHYCGKRNTP